MESIKDIRSNLLKGNIDIDRLKDYQNYLDNNRLNLMSIKVLTNEQFDALHDLLMLYLDYYVYSSEGDILISDHEYDLLMTHFINNGGTLLSKADLLKNQTQWDFVQHESPGMVGTVKKIYSFEELCLYLTKYRSYTGSRYYQIAPKFDGISSAIKISSSGKILRGVTRNNGVEGQDITKVVRNARNSREIAERYSSKLRDGETVWVKTELVVTTQDFNLLINEKKYQNRRSATSGIINTPKNISLARYITIIPLAAHFTSDDSIEYVPHDSKRVKISTANGLMDEITKMLSKIRDSSYPVRTDGVVIYPLGDDIMPNFDDIMDHAVAYKVNTEEGLTTVIRGYVSVGRLGYAIPMLQVKPVEVNETIVSDVSLGSFDKFANMDIHEGEQVIIYSAGDVIPQAKLPEDRKYEIGAPLLQIKKRCPFCGEKLTRYKGTYRCENEDCLRVKAGRISNFVIKLKADNISDKTIEDLVVNKLVRDIPDLFEITENDIAKLDGYGETSAHQIVSEFTRLKTQPTSSSVLLGALGIRGISEKKCRKILKVVSLEKLLKMDKDKMFYNLVDAENVGEKTSATFTDFIEENKSLIKKLIHIMHITNDVKWKGNVVFTGFRRPELEKKFNDLKYEVSNNVNKDTVLVIDASFEHDSTKCNAAKKKGIPIIALAEVNTIWDQFYK